MTRRGRVTAEAFRDLALALPGATEVPHMDRAAFRTPRRIFATLAADEASANLLFDPATQAAWIDQAPAAFAPVPGGWGRMGFTTVTFAHVQLGDLDVALAQAHERASEKAAPKRRVAKRNPTAKPKRRLPPRVR